MTSPARLFFLFSTTLGILITTSSSSWLSCWMGLELNLLSFIPLMSSSHNLYKSEAALKYFLIQALGSAIILFWAPALLVLSSESSQVVLLLAILLKLGAAPFHLWLPSVMQGLHWPQCIILMTLQKIAPLTMVSYLNPSNALTIGIFLSSSLSALVGGLGGMNQTFTRKLLAYSSINHVGWMMTAISFSEWAVMYYFVVYAAITYTVVSILNSQQIFHLSNTLPITLPPSTQLLLFISLFSLGGLPPFLGFFPKMFVIFNLSNQYHMLWASIMIMSSLLTLLFYVRIAIPAITLSSSKIKFNLRSKNELSLSLVTTSINFIPILGPLISFPPF
uniref:NADH-ubiquinone oxidoreductase chain 2 n=1 Tax=Lysmata sp. 1 LQZ-2020 TaxID=2735370 RepID=A0A8X8RG12_9EUCA|nr:NADH dehydrogenase subunit 2 [Lysmata sp. 1 LQZ-2020]